MTKRILRLLTVSTALFLCLALIAPDFAPAGQDPATIVVYITRTGKKYHRGTCRYLRQSKIKTTLAEAKENGYLPCKVCDPPE